MVLYLPRLIDTQRVVARDVLRETDGQRGAENAAFRVDMMRPRSTAFGL